MFETTNHHQPVEQRQRNCQFLLLRANQHQNQDLAKTKLFILFIDSNLIHWQFYAGFLFVFFIFLVGGHSWNIFYFSIYWECHWNAIIPTDFHIFRRGRSTTNQIQLQQPSSFLSTSVHAGAVELCGRPVT